MGVQQKNRGNRVTVLSVWFLRQQQRQHLEDVKNINSQAPPQTH